MQDLPTDIVQRVYQLATPNRKRALLGTCKHLSDSIRPTVTRCLLAQQDVEAILRLPFLPSAFRFQQLRAVSLQCSAGEASRLFGDDWVELEGSGSVTVGFASLNNYRLNQVTGIEGVTGATFRLETQAQAHTACNIVYGACGLEKARLVGKRLELPELNNASLRHLELEGLNFKALNTPSLTTLIAVIPDSILHLSSVTEVPKLTKLVVTADEVCECTRWPAALDFLHLCLSHGGRVSLGRMPALQHLTLINVEGEMDFPADTPALQHLTLCNSLLEEATASDIMEALDFHDRVQTFSLFISHPTYEMETDWREFQDMFMAEGWCIKRQVKLHFEL